MAETFRPGDVVVWAKNAGGGFAYPVLATVVRVTARRVTIQAEDPEERGEGVVIRHVSPARLQLQRRGQKPRAAASNPRGWGKGRLSRPD